LQPEILARLARLAEQVLGVQPATARLIAGALAVACVLVMLHVATSLLRSLWRARPTGAALVRRRARRAAREALESGNWTHAAAQLECMGDHAAARTVRERAARDAGQRGESLRAARHLEALGRKDEAGRLFLRAGDWRSAVACFEACADRLNAARALESGGRLSEAGERYAASGRLEDALRCLTRAAASSVPPARDDVEDRAAIARRAAVLARRLGRHAQAAELYERLGDMDASAECRLAGGNAAAAAEIYERSGDLQRASEAYERAGDVRRAKCCRGRALLQRSEPDAAARMLEEAGEMALAAIAHEQAGHLADAARCHGEAGDLERAAGLFRRAGDLVPAAEAFERVNLPFEAGEIWGELGNTDRAIACFESVTPYHDRFLDARGLLGMALMRRGETSAARVLLEDVLSQVDDNPGCSAHVVPFIHALASCLEADGEDARALEVLRRSALLDPEHGEVRAKIARLRERRREEGAGTPPPPARPLPERYEVVRSLGAGGMGCVWLARDLKLDRLVAVKVLGDQWRGQGQLRERFEREARAVARLSHPNVVSVYDVGEHDGRPYIALEYVSGRDLRDVLAEHGRLPVDEVVPILRGVALALQAAHAAGIVHRDVKPDNILLGEDRTVKVTDFGIARVDDGEITKSGVVMGTPRFISPEQVNAEEVDGRADLYALAGTAFSMLCGRPPFVEGNLAYHQVHTPPPDPRTFVPDLPAPLCDLILRCLSKRPADRPESAEHFLLLLEHATELAGAR
jgi:tetratricopeptide (TPR) repeat protein